MNYNIVTIIVGVLILLYALIDYQLDKALLPAWLGSEIKKEDNEIFYWFVVIFKTTIGIMLIVLAGYKWAISG